MAGGSNVTQQQLAIAQSMLAVTQQMAAAIDDVNKKQQDQVKIMSQIHDTMKLMDTKGLVTALEQVVKSIADLSSKFDSLGKTSQQAISNMTRNAGEASGAINNLNGKVSQTGIAAGATANSLNSLTKASNANKKSVETLSELWKELVETFQKDFPKSASFSIGFIKGLSSAFSGLGSMINVATGLLETIISSFFEIGKAILAIPFNFLDMLTNKANALASGSGEWHRALQEVKKEYGSLKQVSTSALVSMAKGRGTLAAAGINEWRVFGTRAEALTAFLEMSKGMGALWDNFAAEFEATGRQLPALLKGLGLTGEEARAAAAHAKTYGKDLQSTLLTIHKQSFNLGKQFGIATKLISRDIAKAMADVKHFGGATIKQIGQASVYARKLGLELEKIVGTLDAFETFEGAAENASKLSQAFGVQIDAFKMMEAQDPASQVEMLRKSFAAAGKDASNFNRQELSLLATTTGLAPEVAKQAFSLKNQGVALDKLSQQSENADKAQTDLTSALKELKSSMEELTKSGSRSGGFLKQFLESIGIGFERTSQFRQLMYNMIGSMTVVRQEGRRLGRAIMDSFPGIKMFFEGLTEFFRPGKFRTLFGGVVTEVIGYMKKLSAGTASFKDVAKGISGVFDKFVGQQGGAMGKLVEGFKTIFKTISFIASEAIRWVTGHIRDGIIYITDLIAGRKKLTDSGAGSFLSNALEPLGEALMYAWKELSPLVLKLLSDLGDKIWTWIKEKLVPIFMDAMPYIGLALFGPAFVSGIISVLGTSISTAIISAFTGGKVKDAAKTAGQTISSAIQAPAAVAESPISDVTKNIADDNKKIDDLMEKQKDLAKKHTNEMTRLREDATKALMSGDKVEAKALKDLADDEEIRALYAKDEIENLEKKKVKIPDSPAAAAADQLSDASKKVDPDALGQTAKMQEGVNQIADEDKKSKFGLKEAKELGLKLLAIAGAIAVGGVALAGAVALMALILSEVSFADILKSILVLGTMIAGVAALSGVLKLLENVKLDKKVFLTLAGFAIGLGIAGPLFAGVIKDMAENLKETSAVDVMLALMILATLVAGVAALSLSLKLLENVSANAFLGLGIALLAMVGLVGVMALLIEAVTGTKPEEMIAAGAMMASMALVFLAMIPIVFGAMALGAALTASSIFGAAAMGVGLTAMVGGVITVAGSVKTLLTQIAELNLPDNIDKKVEPFVKVLDSIVNAISEIANIVDIVEDLDEDDFSTNMDSIGKFTEKLIGQPNGGGLIGIVETVMKAIKQIKTDELGSSAEIFASMLSAAASLLAALKPPDSLIESTTGFFDDDDALQEGLINASWYTFGITQSLGGLLKTVREETVTLLQELDKFKASPEQLSAIGTVMSSIATFIQAVTPSPALVNSFKETYEQTSNISPDIKKSTINVAAIKEYFDGLKTSLPPLIEALTDGVLSTLIDKLRGFSSQELEQLMKISEVIKSVAELVKSLQASGSEVPNINTKSDGLTIINISKELPDFADIIAKMGKSVIDFVEKIKTVTDSMPSGMDATNFEKKLGLVKSIFELLKLIPEIASSAKTLSKNTFKFGGMEFIFDDPKTIGDYIFKITNFLDHLVVGKNAGHLPDLVAKITTVDKFLSSQKVGRDTVTKVVERVKGFFSGIKDLTDSMAEIKGSMAAIDAMDIPVEDSSLMSQMPVEEITYSIDQSLEDFPTPPEPKKHPMVVALESMSNVLKLITPVSAEVTQNLVLLDLLATGGQNISKLIDRTNVYFSSLKTLANTLLGFRDDAVNKATGTEIFNGISNINDAIVAMGISKGNSVLASLETNMKAIDFDKLEVIQNRMNRLSNIMSKMNESLKGMSTLAGESTLAGSLNKVTQVVEAVNRLNVALGSVNLGTVKAAMTPTTKGMKGNSGTVTVTTTPATFNINLVVDLNAARLEQALIVREESVIRDRLNLMMGDGAPANAASKVPVEGVPKPKGELAEGTRNAIFNA